MQDGSNLTVLEDFFGKYEFLDTGLHLVSWDKIGEKFQNLTLNEMSTYYQQYLDAQNMSSPSGLKHIKTGLQQIKLKEWMTEPSMKEMATSLGTEGKTFKNLHPAGTQAKKKLEEWMAGNTTLDEPSEIQDYALARRREVKTCFCFLHHKCLFVGGLQLGASRSSSTERQRCELQRLRGGDTQNAFVCDVQNARLQLGDQSVQDSKYLG